MSVQPRSTQQVARLMDHAAHVLEKQEGKREVMPVVLCRQEMIGIANALRRQSITGAIATVVILAFVLGFTFHVLEETRDPTVAALVFVGGLLAVTRLAHWPSRPRGLP